VEDAYHRQDRSLLEQRKAVQSNAAQCTGLPPGAQQSAGINRRSGAGVVLAVDRAQPFRCDVRIDLGGRDVGVSEEGLDDAQVGATT